MTQEVLQHDCSACSNKYHTFSGTLKHSQTQFSLHQTPEQGMWRHSRIRKYQQRTEQTNWGYWTCFYRCLSPCFWASPASMLSGNQAPPPPPFTPMFTHHIYLQSTPLALPKAQSPVTKKQKKLRQCHKSKWRYTGLVLLLQTHCFNKDVTCRHRLQPLTLHQLQACKVKTSPLRNGSIEIWKERRKHCHSLTWLNKPINWQGS